MGTITRTFCLAFIDHVWNGEDHAFLRRAVRRRFVIDDGGLTGETDGARLLLNLVNLYKAFVPDLTFKVEGQVVENGRVITDWSASGHHNGVALRVPPTGRAIRLRGRLVATTSGNGRGVDWRGTWDVAAFVRSVGITRQQFREQLNPARDDVVIRTNFTKGGVPILLFPTYTLPGWLTWRRFISVLERERPVVTSQLLANRWAFEHRRVPSTYSVKAETRAIKRGLDRAGLPGPFDVVGYSAGGTLALDFALDYGKQVRSLALIEPGPAWVLQATRQLDKKTATFIRHRMAEYVGRITNDGYAALLQRVVQENGYDPATSAHWPLLCAYKGNTKFRPALFAHTDDVRRLRTARFPVLLVHGSRSDRLHRAIVRALRGCFSDVDVASMPGGHYPHYRPAGATLLLDRLTRFQRACRPVAATREPAIGRPRAERGRQ